MSKVSVTKEKLDTLAEAVGAKSGENIPLTIDQMTSAVLGIELVNNQDKTTNPTESRQYITPDSGYTGLSQVVIEPISSTYIGSGISRKSATDLTVSGATVSVPAGYYNATASKSVATATHPNPTVSVNASGLITASHTQGTGYVTGGTTTTTMQLTTKGATTITPSTATQTAVASGVYTTGAITVAAIQTQEKSTTSNGTITPDAGKYLTKVTVNVPVGATINNQDKTVTPTKVQQSIVADSSYTGLGEVTVEAIPAEYITTDDANATASEILNSKTVYVKGLKVTGTMPNNGATGGTITSQGGTYTIPAGYTSGGTVTVSLSVSTITNGVLNVATVTEATNDYGVEASITIPAGYYTATTLSKVLSTVLPAPSKAIAISQMLAGYQAYNNEGQLLTGTMTNHEDWGATLDQTTTSVTIPEGYHNGTGKVSHTTVNIPDPTFSMNNSTGVITASGTWTRGFTTDNSYTKTYSLTTQTGTTITPTETAQTAVAANRWTTGTVTVDAIPSDYIGSGVTTRSSADLTVSGATITAPAGYYSAAASKSVASMTLPTAASTTSTSGATKKATIDRSTSVRYINIPVGYNDTPAYYQISAVANGSATNSGTASASSATLTTGNNTITLSKAVSITPTINAGYISSGTAGNVTVQLTATVTTKAAATITPGTTTQTISANQYLTGAQTIAGDADLVAGNIRSGVNIFGVNGTFTSDATATAADIVDGETAYVNGSKITGSMVVNYYYTGSTSPSASLGNNGDIYLQE